MRVSRQHLKTILTVDISSCCFRRCTPERHVLISPNVKRGNANGTDTSVEVESAIPVESGGRSLPHSTTPPDSSELLLRDVPSQKYPPAPPRPPVIQHPPPNLHHSYKRS